LAETFQGNAGNDTDQPRRARSSTERSRAHRARKKLEREAALHEAEAERVAEAVAGVACAVASVENAVAGAAPRPTEPKVEREAAALHEAGEAEREAGATETATIERVAGWVADVAEAVAPENVVSSLPTVDVAGVPAVPPAVEWRVLERPAWRPTVPAFCRWTFGGMFVALSFALYFISTFLNMTFWANLNPDATAKQILAAAGLISELTNYAIPSAISFVPLSQWVLRLVLKVVLSVTMILTAIAGASVVKNSLGSSHETRQESTKTRHRLQALIDTPMKPVDEGSVVDARGRRDTAKAAVKADCAPTRSKDLDQCARSRAAVLQADAALAQANETHNADVKAAKEQHRQDVADAQTKLDGMLVISLDLDMVAAGVEALVPGVPEAWVTRIVVLLWVLLFSLGPCALLRSGLEILAPARTASH
jgi:hypothetical protein